MFVASANYKSKFNSKSLPHHGLSTMEKGPAPKSFLFLEEVGRLSSAKNQPIDFLACSSSPFFFSHQDEKKNGNKWNLPSFAGTSFSAEIS